MWNLFRVSNEDIVKTPLTSFWRLYYELWTDFTHCSGVSIADVEQLNNSIASWDIWQGKVKSLKSRTSYRLSIIAAYCNYSITRCAVSNKRTNRSFLRIWPAWQQNNKRSSSLLNININIFLLHRTHDNKIFKYFPQSKHSSNVEQVGRYETLGGTNISKNNWYFLITFGNYLKHFLETFWQLQIKIWSYWKFPQIFTSFFKINTFYILSFVTRYEVEIWTENTI